MSDAKWVVRILGFFVVAAAALVMSLARLTERETALTLISTITATMFSPKGLDDPGDIETLKAGLKAKPGQTLEPLPGVTITAADVEGKSPRKLRLMIFRRLAEPIYDQGTFKNSKTNGNTRAESTSEANRAIDTSEVKEARESKASAVLTPTADNLGLLVLLSNESHQKLLGIQKILLIASSILLLLLIFFSTGFGRLASPGWVLLLVSGAPMLLIFLIEMSLRTHPPAAPTGDLNIATVAASAGTAVAPLALGAFKATYQPLALTGSGLIVVGTLGGIIWHFTHRSAGNTSEVNRAIDTSEVKEAKRTNKKGQS